MTPIECLELVLDPEHAKGVLDHRKALKKPLTELAAKLLARQFALCPDPNAAAEAMLIAGWIGFKPDWIIPDIRSQRFIPKRNVYDAAQSLIEEMETANANRPAQIDGPAPTLSLGFSPGK